LSDREREKSERTRERGEREALKDRKEDANTHWIGNKVSREGRGEEGRGGQGVA